MQDLPVVSHSVPCVVMFISQPGDRLRWRPLQVKELDFRTAFLFKLQEYIINKKHLITNTYELM